MTAGVLALWTVLQAATMVVAAVRGGAPDLAFAFWATGLFTIVLGMASWSALRWAVRGNPTNLAGQAEPEPVRHGGLCGEVAPPTRW